MAKYQPPDVRDPEKPCNCLGLYCPNCPCAEDTSKRAKKAKILHGIGYTLLLLMLAWSLHQQYHEVVDIEGNVFLFRMGWTDASTKVWGQPNKEQLRAFWEHVHYMRSEAARRDADKY